MNLHPVRLLDHRAIHVVSCLSSLSPMDRLPSHFPRCPGFHLEGPFISSEKRGAHPERFLRTFQSGGTDDLMETYGSLDNVAMVTLAPELPHSQSVVSTLRQKGVTVSLGGSP